MGLGGSESRLRALPKVDRIAAALSEEGPPSVVTDAARRAIDEARELVLIGSDVPDEAEVIDAARRILAERERSLLRPVINATGVLIHTNLGRVPLGERQLRAVAGIAGGYSNLEYELGAGRRGSRYSHAHELLTAVTGAESALVVNNNAAAVLLVLSALCVGREVIISRGELIEIGGEFRLPDVMAASGARLVEVGTTNRTHIGDYERSIGEHTAAILKVHPSNFRVVGFTAQVSARDLARLARGRGVLMIHDLGSGLVDAPDEEWIRAEPLVSHTIDEGADLVTFSGDKLLGGPQAGVIVGRAALIRKLSAHPMMRALRVDKMTLAALEATLAAYIEGRAAELPLWRMANAPAEELRDRARRLAEVVSEGDVKAEAVTTEAVTGGGSLPATGVGSWGVAITHPERSSDDLQKALRLGSTPVIGRIEDDRLLLDVRTVPPEQDATLAQLVLRALA
jgi:L-seryl-tRNA(Ser) seleniumtransferase